MHGPRTRRVVRRIALTLAAVVLLLVWYVGAWLTVSRAEHDRMITAATARKVRPAFVPILKYCDSDLPGAGFLSHLWWSVNPPMLDFSQPRFPGPGVRGLYSALAPPQTTASREALKAVLLEDRAARRPSRAASD